MEVCSSLGLKVLLLVGNAQGQALGQDGTLQFLF